MSTQNQYTVIPWEAQTYVGGKHLQNCKNTPSSSHLHDLLELFHVGQRLMAEVGVVEVGVVAALGYRELRAARVPEASPLLARKFSPEG